MTLKEAMKLTIDGVDCVKEDEFGFMELGFSWTANMFVLMVNGKLIDFNNLQWKGLDGEWKVKS